MKQLFKAATVEQVKIEAWLREQGLTSADVANVELLGRDRIELTNPAGQWMIVVCRDGKVEIDQNPKQLQIRKI